MLFCSSSFTLRAMSSLAASYNKRVGEWVHATSKRVGGSPGSGPCCCASKMRHSRAATRWSAGFGSASGSGSVIASVVLGTFFNTKQARSYLTGEHIVQRHARHGGAHLQAYA